MNEIMLRFDNLVRNFFVHSPFNSIIVMVRLDLNIWRGNGRPSHLQQNLGMISGQSVQWLARSQALSGQTERQTHIHGIIDQFKVLNVLWLNLKYPIIKSIKLFSVAKDLDLHRIDMVLLFNEASYRSNKVF